MPSGVQRIRMPGWKGPQGWAGPGLWQTLVGRVAQQPGRQMWGVSSVGDSIGSLTRCCSASLFLVSGVPRTLPGSDLYPLGIISPPDSWLKGSPLAATLEVLDCGAEVSCHAGHTVALPSPLPAFPSLGAGPFCVLFVQQRPKLPTVLWLWPSRHWECGILGDSGTYFVAFLQTQAHFKRLRVPVSAHLLLAGGLGLMGNASNLKLLLKSLVTQSVPVCN